MCFAPEHRRGLASVRRLHLRNWEEVLCLNAEVVRRWKLQVGKNSLLPVSGPLMSLLYSACLIWGLVTLAFAFL